MKDTTKILKWEMAGVFFIFLFGGLLHFVFDLLGKWPPLAMIAAVNESVWEHLKLAFWPAFLFALIEWPYFRKQNINFWAAKAFGIFTMPIIIVSVFYTYTALAGHHILWVDISVFFTAVFVGQMISARLFQIPSIDLKIRIVAMILIVLMIVAFSLFTFFPPSLPLFCDPQTGQYGILK